MLVFILLLHRACEPNQKKANLWTEKLRNSSSFLHCFLLLLLLYSQRSLFRPRMLSVWKGASCICVRELL